MLMLSLENFGCACHFPLEWGFQLCAFSSFALVDCIYRVQQKLSCKLFAIFINLVILCAHNGIIIIQLAYFVQSYQHYSDFSVHKNFCTKTGSWELYSELALNSCLDFITKETCPLNSPELNPLDYYIWVNVKGLSQVSSKTEDITDLK